MRFLKKISEKKFMQYLKDLLAVPKDPKRPKRYISFTDCKNINYAYYVTAHHYAVIESRRRGLRGRVAIDLEWRLRQIYKAPLVKFRCQ